jgi:DNA-binding GntR family transcriptional regulator
VPRSLISQQIEQAIKEDILSGSLKAGQKISMGDLETKWGTSSTPVRDAIKSLASKGLLVVAPRESIKVSTLSRKMVKEVFELKIALECAAIEIALPQIPQPVIEDILEKCKSANRLFTTTKDVKQLFKIDHLVHQLIREYCDNERLLQILSDVSDVIYWARSVGVNQLQSMEFAVPEQLHILNMIRRKDTVGAQEAMRIHLRNLYRRTIESIDSLNGRGSS